MSIEVVLEGTLEQEKDKEQFSAYLKEVCEKNQVHMEDYDATIMISLCPEGFIECSYEQTFISIAAQTNVAGPGFHAYVCTLFDEIIKTSPIAFEISDPTGYYENRDFEALKYKYFYRWLYDIAEYVKDHHDDVKNLCISWPVDYYQPKGKAHAVVTPMGYIDVDEFKQSDIEALAQRFFIWNEQGFTASYYRNAALSLLWKECYFHYSSMNEYSDKMAAMILDYLEAAYDMDQLVPLPLEAYHIVCQALGREELIHHGEDLGIKNIGYRLDTIYYPFGNWKIAVDGCSEQGYDEKSGTLHFMAPYTQEDHEWQWLIKANAYVSQEEVAFSDAIRTQKEHRQSFTIENAYYQAQGIIEKMDDYYTMIVQYIHDKEMLLMEIIIRKEEDIARIKGWCEEVEHHQQAKEENQVN